MVERRVQVGGRGVYTRSVPLRPPKRRGWRPPTVAVPAKRGIVLAVLALAGAGVFMNVFRVREVVVVAPSGQERVRAEAQAIIDRAGWLTTVWTIDTGEVASKLQQADPLVKSVQVSRLPPRSLRLAVVYNEPVMVWLSGNQPVLLDSRGVAIAAAPATPPKVPVVVDGSNLPFKPGDRVVAGHFVAFVTALVPELTKRGLAPAQIQVGDTTLDLTVQTTKGYRLVFDTSREVGDELVDLDAVQRTLAAQKKTPAEYIDLRISGKAYYK